MTRKRARARHPITAIKYGALNRFIDLPPVEARLVLDDMRALGFDVLNAVGCINIPDNICAPEKATRFVVDDGGSASRHFGTQLPTHTR